MTTEFQDDSGEAKPDPVPVPSDRGDEQSAAEQGSMSAEADQKEEKLEFIPQQTVPCPVKPAPTAEKERQLLGELIFLKVWSMMKISLTAETANENSRYRNASPLQLCGKMVGMMVQLQVEELRSLVGNKNQLSARLGEAARVLRIKVIGTQEVTQKQEDFPAGGPSGQRRKELMLVALIAHLGDKPLAMTFLGPVLASMTAEDTWACLLDMTKLKNSVKQVSKSFERELRGMQEAQQRLLEFEAIPAGDLPILLTPARRGQGGAAAAGQAKGRVQVMKLLREAEKYTKNPVLVAKKIAAGFAAAKQSLSIPHVALMELCGIQQDDLTAMGVRLHYSAGRVMPSTDQLASRHVRDHRRGNTTRAASLDPGLWNGEPDARNARNRSGASPARKRRSSADARRPQAPPPVNGEAIEKSSWQQRPSAGKQGLEQSKAPSSQQEEQPRLFPSQESRQASHSEAKKKELLVEPETLLEKHSLGKTVPGVIRVSEPVAEELRRPKGSQSSQEPFPVDSEGDTAAEEPDSRASDKPHAVQEEAAPSKDEVELEALVEAALEPEKPKPFLSALLQTQVKQQKQAQTKPKADFSLDDSSQQFPSLGGSKSGFQRSSSVDPERVARPARVALRASSAAPAGKPDTGVDEIRAPPKHADAANKEGASVRFADPEPVRAPAPTRASQTVGAPAASRQQLTRTGSGQRASSGAPSRLHEEQETVSSGSLQLGAPKKAGSSKKKAHMWSPVMDAFEAARAKNEVNNSAASVPKAPDPTPAKGKEVAAQDMTTRLQELSEAKLQALQNEDFDLAQVLKEEAHKLQKSLEKSLESSSWASIATPSPKQAKAGTALRPKARAAGEMLRPASKPSATITGNLVFVLTVPGEANAESFKPTATHVCRRDALARIATAALWRGRGLPWDDVQEIVFLFEDSYALRLQPRFVPSCPVPSEYHLIMVLGRALENEGAPGAVLLDPNEDQVLGGHVGTVVGEYARAGPTTVALLHEAYAQNLGLFSERPNAEDKDHTLIFFLGAVKDMTTKETRAVQQACRIHNVPCVEANLGAKAEFTSKIIDILHGHHLYGRLLPAVRRCARRPPVGGTASGMEIKEAAQAQRMKAPGGTFWVFIPVGGAPQDLVADDKKSDGTYEVPRCCISQLWCSKDEHGSHALSFVFPTGEVLTVYASLVTCLKMQHRAAPTERNLVNALRVGMGDWKADPSLVIDKGCLTLGTAADIWKGTDRPALDPVQTALLQLQLGDASGEQLTPYFDGPPPTGKGVRDIVMLLHTAGGRDFPRGFRETLAESLGQKRPWIQLSMPRLSIHAGISLLGHYWDMRVLPAALAPKMRGRISEGEKDEMPSSKISGVPKNVPGSPKKSPGTPPGKPLAAPPRKDPPAPSPKGILRRREVPAASSPQEEQNVEGWQNVSIPDPLHPADRWEDLVD